MISFNLFALGFRIFFLSAAYAALFLVGLWLMIDRNGSFDNYYSAVDWHSHEMIFGYSVAVIAGFLLTAVGNWTGQPTVTGPKLGLLALLWFYGRVVPFFSAGLPALFIAAVDLAFLPVLAIVLAVPIVQVKQYRNLFFVIVLLVMTFANGLIHIEQLGLFSELESTGWLGIQLGLAAIITMIVFISGRIVPFFTERGLPGSQPKRRPQLDTAATASVVLWFIVTAIDPSSAATGFVALLAAGLNSYRLLGWYDRGIWRIPLLWVLYCGYGWIIIGFILSAFAAFGLFPPSLATHAFTIGGIAVLTLGMMARVSLGHSGRPLETTGAMAFAFVLINLAAVVRLLPPIIEPAWYSFSVTVSGSLWLLAFVLFLYRYTGILIAPRADGRPG